MAQNLSERVMHDLLRILSGDGVKNSAKTDDGGAKNDGFGDLPSFDP